MTVVAAQIVKLAALAAFVALLCAIWLSPLAAAAVGAGVLYLLMVAFV